MKIVKIEIRAKMKELLREPEKTIPKGLTRKDQEVEPFLKRLGDCRSAVVITLYYKHIKCVTLP